MRLRSISGFPSTPSPASFQILARFATASSPAEEFHSHLRRNGNAADLERALATVNAKLDAKCVTDVIALCDPSQAQMGLRFFVWAGLQHGYRHSPYAYGRACKSFNVIRNPEAIRDVVEAYGSARFSVSAKTFKIVLNLCKEAELADEALWVLRKMSEFGLRGDSTMYSVVIRLFCWKGDMDGADSLMKEMMGLGDLYPDMPTFVEMVNGFCRAGRFDEAFKLFRVAKEQGCLLNKVLCSSLVNGLCKNGDMDRALQLLDEMESGGEEIRPNAVTYTCVIQRFCEEGRTPEAMAILDRMEALRCPPNQVTASCLIERVCKEDRVEEVHGLIDKIVGAGGVSYEKCCSSFVVALKRIGRFEEAEKVFRNMVSTGLRPDGLASYVVMKEICSAGRVLDGYRLCIEIDKIECLPAIDSSIFSVLLAGLCQQEYLAEAAELAKLMLKRGIQPKAPYAKSIVKNIKKSGYTELARNFTGI